MVGVCRWLSCRPANGMRLRTDLAASTFWAADPVGCRKVWQPRSWGPALHGEHRSARCRCLDDHAVERRRRHLAQPGLDAVDLRLARAAQTHLATATGTRVPGDVADGSQRRQVGPRIDAERLAIDGEAHLQTPSGRDRWASRNGTHGGLSATMIALLDVERPAHGAVHNGERQRSQPAPIEHDALGVVQHARAATPTARRGAR